MNRTLQNNSKRGVFAYFLLIACLLISPHLSAQGVVESWKTSSQAGQGGEVGNFFRQVTQVLLYVCAVASVIIIVLAFKGLAGQGDWRTFWNKIAGGIGIFAVPTIINWLIGLGA